MFWRRLCLSVLTALQFRQWRVVCRGAAAPMAVAWADSSGAAQGPVAEWGDSSAVAGMQAIRAVAGDNSAAGRGATRTVTQAISMTAGTIREIRTMNMNTTQTRRKSSPRNISAKGMKNTESMSSTSSITSLRLLPESMIYN